MEKNIPHNGSMFTVSCKVASDGNLTGYEAFVIKQAYRCVADYKDLIGHPKLVDAIFDAICIVRTSEGHQINKPWLSWMDFEEEFLYEFAGFFFASLKPKIERLSDFSESTAKMLGPVNLVISMVNFWKNGSSSKPPNSVADTPKTTTLTAEPKPQN